MDRQTEFARLHEKLCTAATKTWESLSFTVTLHWPLLAKYSVDRRIDGLDKDLSSVRTDQIASHLLPKNLENEFRPIVCYGDGNCLFRSVSLHVMGNEEHHVEFRVRTIMDLVRHEKLYLNEEKLKNVSSKEAASNESLLHYILCTSVDNPQFVNQRNTLREHIMQTTKSGKYASLVHIYALPNVLNRPVQSVYPDIPNAGVDPHIHNQTIQPWQQSQSDHMTFMWSHLTDAGRTDGPWDPNHFVLLVPLSKSNKRKTGKYTIVP